MSGIDSEVSGSALQEMEEKTMIFGVLVESYLNRK